MKRQIPYTITNFKDIVTKNFYYVDKTMYLPQLEQYRHPVFLRPRRFGKSLFTEMLRYYYDLKYASEFEQLFGNLWIGKNPTPNHNQYFFLALDFSGMGAYAKEEEKSLRNRFSNLVISELKQFIENNATYLQLSKTEITDIYNDFIKPDVDAGFAMNIVAKKVASVGGKMFIAIDEYDSLTNSMAIYYKHESENSNLYLNILSKSGFFRAFFETLKNNSKTGIERVYITGILPITIADMNSGYNIAQWLTFKPAFVNMLGITESEFDTLLDEIYTDYQIDIPKLEVKEIIRKYYDGYKFSAESEAVYNPSMTMYALENLVIEGKMPKKLLDSNIRIDYNQIEYIFGNNTETRDKVITTITDEKQLFFGSTLEVSFDMKAYREGRFITEGLYYSGILTFTDNNYILRIPNIVTYDMALSYFERIQNYLPDANDNSDVIKDYIISANAESLINKYFTNVIQRFPGQFFSNANESFYHGLLFHILFNSLQKDMYEVLPEYNLPQGRADIMSRSLPKAKVMAHFQDLFEFKQVPKSAKDGVFESKFNETVEHVKRYTPAGWRGIAVCFRGNLDYKIEIKI